jgi:hypothetical protein
VATSIIPAAASGGKSPCIESQIIRALEVHGPLAGHALQTLLDGDVLGALGRLHARGRIYPIRTTGRRKFTAAWGLAAENAPPDPGTEFAPLDLFSDEEGGEL